MNEQESAEQGKIMRPVTPVVTVSASVRLSAISTFVKRLFGRKGVTPGNNNL